MHFERKTRNKEFKPETGNFPGGFCFWPFPVSGLHSLFLVLFVFTLSGCGENLTSPDHGAYPSTTVAPLSCLPNLDGKIDSAELGVAFNVPIHYLVSPPGVERTVDLAGKKSEAGLSWDLSVDYADDAAIVVAAADAQKRWYGKSFPAGAFATPLDPAGTTENVGRLDDKALWLLGVASAQENPKEGKTLLVYQPPIQVVQFPIQPGQSFVSTGSIANGTLRGLPYAGKDVYEVSVDASGEVVLPALTFTQALRVETHVTVQPAVGMATSRRQVSFFFECFGEVARAVSRAGESQANFSTAAELRRIGLE